MMTQAEAARAKMIHHALDRDKSELSRRDVFLIGAINNVVAELRRLRHAAFGLDREDRIQIAMRLSAEHHARQKTAKRTTRRRRPSRGASRA
jgi:hypothetical protein